MFYGVTLLNEDYENMRIGYISFSELRRFKNQGVEVECVPEKHWNNPKLSQINKIRRGFGWDPLRKEKKS